CLALEAELANLRETNNQDNQTELINQFSKLEVTHLQAQNDLFRVENNKIKQHYKELYDSIKITHAKHIKQVTKVTTKNMNLKIGVSKATVNPIVSARDKHAIDVEPIVPRLRNNRNAHLDYLRHLKESVEMIRDIVEEAKVVRPLDRSIVSACRYTKHSQELLEYAIGTCPHGSQPRVDCCPISRKSQPMSHVKPNRISPAKDKMADVTAPSDQIPTMASPVQKSQSNPIYKIAVDLLKNTNFFRAFTASSNLPSIYIQQFWDKILYDKKARCYKCQLDERWFDLTKETLREALQITPVNHNQAFAAPPSINGLIDFVNQLGYPKQVINLSTVVTNDMF
nr:hypothetical protein [Tanacetum cinerariifolium]